jgi:predicted nucleic acid-binding protein
LGLIVLDASAAVELLLQTVSGQSLRSKLSDPVEIWVPEHFLVEVASVLRRVELRQPRSALRMSRALDRLVHGAFHRVQVRGLLPLAWERRGHLTVADALYVVLAEQLDAPLVTADLALAASPGLVVPTITP